MLLVGIAMERGLIKHFYKRPHAEQILVTFGLAIVIGEIIKATFGPNPIPQPMPDPLRGSTDIGAWLGLQAGVIPSPPRRLLTFPFSMAGIHHVLPFLTFPT